MTFPGNNWSGTAKENATLVKLLYKFKDTYSSSLCTQEQEYFIRDKVHKFQYCSAKFEHNIIPLLSEILSS